MLDEIAKALLVYGPLGIISLVSMLTTLKLYRDLTAERERNRKTEDALVERFVSKAESWTTRYHELAESQVALMERIEKLLERAIYRDQRGGP